MESIVQNDLRLPNSRSRDERDGLEDPRGDLIRVALGVWTAVFEVALVVVLHEAVRHADGSAAVGEAVGELVDRLGLVETGQAKVVVRAVDGNVLLAMLAEGSHECF